MKLGLVDIIMLRLYKGPASEDDLIQTLDIGKETTECISRLEKSEYIERIKRDRYILLKLTKRGERYIESRVKEVLEVA